AARRGVRRRGGPPAPPPPPPFSWEAAWDHAAGLLLVTEAGGAHLTRDRVPFRYRGGNALPFTAARDLATAERVVKLLGG
ncbi:hypothetical protein ACFV3T_29610, partial [Streptomyces albidoflavus]